MLEIKLFQMRDRQVHFIFFEKERTLQHMKQEHFPHLTKEMSPGRQEDISQRQSTRRAFSTHALSKARRPTRNT